MSDAALSKLVASLLLLLAFAGLVNAAYFTLIYYRVVDAGARRIPAFCRLENHTCEAVVFTRYGRLFSIPNSLMGLTFYVLIACVAASRLTTVRFHYLDVALGGSAAAVILGIYLVYALLARLKAP